MRNDTVTMRNDGERRGGEFAGAAGRQVFALLGWAGAVFALPILANGMFSSLPPDYVALRHTLLSRFLMDAYEAVYAPLNPYAALALILGALGGLGWAVVKTQNPMRGRLPLTALMMLRLKLAAGLLVMAGAAYGICAPLYLSLGPSP